jgi:hypothetical protein
VVFQCVENQHIAQRVAVLWQAAGAEYFCGMSKIGEIHLTDALRLLDVVTDASGEYILHTVGFITYARQAKSERGRYRVIRNCHKTGLPFGVSSSMMRGLRDSVTNEVRAVHIRLMVMFDGMKVVW